MIHRIRLMHSSGEEVVIFVRCDSERLGSYVTERIEDSFGLEDEQGNENAASCSVDDFMKMMGWLK